MAYGGRMNDFITRAEFQGALNLLEQLKDVILNPPPCREPNDDHEDDQLTIFHTSSQTPVSLRHVDDFDSTVINESRPSTATPPVPSTAESSHDYLVVQELQKLSGEIKELRQANRELLEKIKNTDNRCEEIVQAWGPNKPPQRPLNQTPKKYSLSFDVENIRELSRMDGEVVSPELDITHLPGLQYHLFVRCTGQNISFGFDDIDRGGNSCFHPPVLPSIPRMGYIIIKLYIHNPSRSLSPWLIYKNYTERVLTDRYWKFCLIPLAEISNKGYVHSGGISVKCVLRFL